MFKGRKWSIRRRGRCELVVFHMSVREERALIAGGQTDAVISLLFSLLFADSLISFPVILSKRKAQKTKQKYSRLTFKMNTVLWEAKCHYDVCLVIFTPQNQTTPVTVWRQIKDVRREDEDERRTRINRSKWESRCGVFFLCVCVCFTMLFYSTFSRSQINVFTTDTNTVRSASKFP